MLWKLSFFISNVQFKFFFFFFFFHFQLLDKCVTDKEEMEKDLFEKVLYEFSFALFTL